MKQMQISLAAGLLGVAGAAAAAGHVVEWGRVEGFGAADTTLMHVGPFNAAHGRTVGSGHVLLNLDTGRLTFRVDGLTNGDHYNNGPLGAPWTAGDVLVGTVVCDSTERFGAMSWADSTPVAFDAHGNGTFRGAVRLPGACRDRPEEIVFLLRYSGSAPTGFVAYGAGRVIR